MTSTSIYTPITPTYLYIKQHSITKKKYFGKTIRKDPLKYLGSGNYWKEHINKYGKEFVETIWLSDLYYDTSISEHALHFSCENNIVKSNDWANLMPETGLEGFVSDFPMSAETKAKMSAAKKDKPLSPEHIAKMSASRTGGKRSDETKAKMSASQKGKKKGPMSDETKAKISATNTGKKKGPLSAETKAKLSTSHIGKKHSEETKAKMSAANTGTTRRKHSEETKAK